MKNKVLKIQMLTNEEFYIYFRSTLATEFAFSQKFFRRIQKCLSILALRLENEKKTKIRGFKSALYQGEKVDTASINAKIYFSC